jgi:hypothetical protein
MATDDKNKDSKMQDPALASPAAVQPSGSDVQRSPTGRPLRERERPPLPNMNASTAEMMRNAPSMNAAPDYSAEDEDTEMESVINHEPRLLVWPDIAVREGDKPDGRVLRTIPGPRLIPGRNNVPREYLERVGLTHGDHRAEGAHPHIGRHFKHRMVTIGGDVDDPMGPGKPEDLSTVPAKGAKVLIAEETDTAVLDRWAITERRSDVSRLIAQRKQELGHR